MTLFSALRAMIRSTVTAAMTTCWDQLVATSFTVTTETTACEARVPRVMN